MNQTPPLPEHDAYAWNVPLQDAVRRADAAGSTERLHALGRIVGSVEARAHAERADRHPPVLHRYDAAGERIDLIERDPSWHWLVGQTLEHDLHGLPYRDGVVAPYSTRAAGVLTWAELDLPTVCPVSGNFSMVSALDVDPELAGRWRPRLLARDPSDVAFGAASMTERQGGSDVRALSTTAARQADGSYLLTGAKWFVTCPWADIVLVLARTPDGISCFLVESREPGYRIERLKNTLGWRALGVGEVELHDVPARLLGEEGRGVATIMRMITGTRLDVVLENAASMRRGVLRAVHHSRHRNVSGRALVEQPVMRSVLADLALEAEAATFGAMHVARNYDVGAGDDARFALTLLKYWVTKRASMHAAECLECLGGNAYVEESGMPRLLRNAVLGSIWEGSGNVLALNVVQTARQSPDRVQRLLDGCLEAAGSGGLPGRFISETKAMLSASASDAEASARGITERLALLLQASVLLRDAPAGVAEAFCSMRLERPGLAFGAAPSPGRHLIATLIERVLPS